MKLKNLNNLSKTCALIGLCAFFFCTAPLQASADFTDTLEVTEWRDYNSQGGLKYRLYRNFYSFFTDNSGKQHPCAIYAAVGTNMDVELECIVSAAQYYKTTGQRYTSLKASYYEEETRSAAASIGAGSAFFLQYETRTYKIMGNSFTYGYNVY